MADARRLSRSPPTRRLSLPRVMDWKELRLRLNATNSTYYVKFRVLKGSRIRSGDEARRDPEFRARRRCSAERQWSIEADRLGMGFAGGLRSDNPVSTGPQRRTRVLHPRPEQ